MTERELLRIAVPNKGSLAEAAAGMLHESGYRQRTDSKELVLVDSENGVEFYYLRPRDIAVYVGEGTLDLGITGRDMLLDSGAHADEVMQLGFGATRFRFAAPGGRGLTLAGVSGKRIATSYPGLLAGYLARHGLEARLIRLDGAVESSIRLGVADVVADVVETGSTLKAAGLELFGDPILESEAVLIKRSGAEPPEGMDQLVRRLGGVLTAHHFLMVDYVVEEVRLERVSLLTPGQASPTVSPVEKTGWVAVRAMIRAKEAQSKMDELWAAGARAIVLTEIAACRL